MPLTPKEISDINDLIKEKLEGHKLHTVSASSTTRSVTVIKTSSGITGLGRPQRVIEALLSILEPNAGHHISSKLTETVESIKEILEKPELYVTKSENYQEFQGIIKQCIGETIQTLRQLSPEAAKELRAENRRLKQEKHANNQRVATAPEPVAGDERATLMLSDEEYQERLARQFLVEDVHRILPFVPIEQLFSANAEFLEMALRRRYVRRIITSSSFEHISTMFNENPEKFNALVSHGTNELMHAARINFRLIESIYDHSEETFHFIIQRPVIRLLTDGVTNYQNIERLCLNYPDKLDFIAHHNTRDFMNITGFDFNKVSEFYDANEAKLRAVAHPFVNTLINQRFASFEEVCSIYDENPEKLKAVSNPDISRVVRLTCFADVCALYDKSSEEFLKLSDDNKNLSKDELQDRINSIIHPEPNVSFKKRERDNNAQAEQQSHHIERFTERRQLTHAAPSFVELEQQRRTQTRPAYEAEAADTEMDPTGPNLQQGNQQLRRGRRQNRTSNRRS